MMGNLKEVDCDNCKYLFSTISSGFCEKTKHRVIYVEDSKRALTCEYYQNKYEKE